MIANSKIYILVICFTCIFVFGCSRQDWHQGLRTGHIMPCNKVPSSEYNDCVKSTADSYEDYKKTQWRYF